MPEHTTHGHLPNLKVTPPAEVLDEIANRNTNVNHLIEEAKLLLIQTNEETAVARYFIERGYSDAFANWLSEEAKAREDSLGTGTAGTDGR